MTTKPALYLIWFNIYILNLNIQPYKLFKKFTQFCTFNIHIFQKIYTFLHIQPTQFFPKKKKTYTIFQKTYTIMYIQRTHFIRMCTILYIQLTQFCTLNVQIFFKKCMQFCTFNKHKFSKNVYSLVHWPSRISKECVQFRTFNALIF